MVVRSACSIGPNHAQGSMVKGIRTFLVEFADDLITVNESVVGVEGLCICPSLPCSWC